MNIHVIVKIVSLIFLSAQLLFGQQKERYENEDNQEQQESDNEFTYGINWNTNGGIVGGVMAKYSWQHKKYQYQYHFISLEAAHVTHPKEITTGNYSITPFQGNYIEGKIGNLFSIRPQFGREIVVFNKAQEEGVRVSVIFAAGPSIGLLVPYYVNYITKTESRNGQTVIIETKDIPYDTTLLDNNIVESSGFFTSLGGRIKPYIGIHAKASLNFEYGQFKSSVAGIEIGAMVEQFTSTINIIPKSQNGHSLFFSVFLTAYFGSR